MKACTQCGRCCTNPRFMGSLQATGDDILRWQVEGREDILAYAVILGHPDDPFADLWVSPRTGEEASRCPFVRKIRGQDKYTCTIYDTRPQVCRDYPQHVSHMRSVDCEMLESGDTDAIVRRSKVR